MQFASKGLCQTCHPIPTPLPQTKIPVHNSTEYQIIKVRKYRENILNQVWKQWKSYYLLQLQSLASIGKLTSQVNLKKTPLFS